MEGRKAVSVMLALALLVVGMGLLVWSVRRFAPSAITPQQAYEIQKEEIEGAARMAPPHPQPGKYQPPSGFQPAKGRGN